MANQAYTMRIIDTKRAYVHQVIERATGKVVSERKASRMYEYALCDIEEGKTTRIENGFGRLDLAAKYLRAYGPDLANRLMLMEPVDVNGRVQLLVKYEPETETESV